MNNNSSKQILLSVIGVAILVVAVVGVSFAFFSYVYNGQTANTVQTGTIVFGASETNIKLTNVFPTTAYNTGVEHQTDVLDSVISVYGKTTYENGIKYTVRVKDVTNATPAEENGVTIIPRVVVIPNTNAGVDFTAGYGVEKVYGDPTKTLTGDGEGESLTKLESNMTIAQGKIDANEVIGSEDGSTSVEVVRIRAYYDRKDYHISDNNKSELVAAGLLQDSYAGTIIKPADWNAMSKATNAYSFKIQVTAVEGDSADPRFQVQP